MTTTVEPDDEVDAARTPVGDARHWLAGQIRSKVVGNDAAGRGAAIFDGPGPRWLADDSPARTVHGDASMFVGGLRALLLQSLHPLAMAGVAEHSDYRADPWGRLQRTADFIAVTTFGSVAMAEQAVAIVHRVHERVVGVAPDGRPYAANDPHLLAWVHLAEIDSFLTAHQRFGSAPLDPDAGDRYVHDVAGTARALGVVDPPTSVAELQAQLAAFRPELRSTAAARRAARYLIFEPPLPLVVRPAYFALASAAVSSLPSWARWPLRVPFLPVSERLVVSRVGAAATGVIRWTMQDRA